MSNLKSIVPPVELCKRIPEGEFEGSVFAWRYPAYDERNRRLLNGWEVIEVNWYAVKEYKKKYDERFFPAPTLEEVFDALADLGADFLMQELQIGNKSYCYPTGVEEALRLWFEVKGIKVEK